MRCKNTHLAYYIINSHRLNIMKNLMKDFASARQSSDILVFREYSINQIKMACEIIKYIVPDENIQPESLDSDILNLFANNEFEAAIEGIILKNSMKFFDVSELKDFILEALSLALMLNSQYRKKAVAELPPPTVLAESEEPEELTEPKRDLPTAGKPKFEIADGKEPNEREALLKQLVAIYKKVSDGKETLSPSEREALLKQIAEIYKKLEIFDKTRKSREN